MKGSSLKRKQHVGLRRTPAGLGTFHLLVPGRQIADRLEESRPGQPGTGHEFEVLVGVEAALFQVGYEVVLAVIVSKMGRQFIDEKVLDGKASGASLPL
jgi:hypothetical protein